MGVRFRLLLTAAALALLLLPAGSAHAGLPPVKHVFIIVLENKDYDQSFGAASQAPYLAHELTAKGQLLEQYYGTSHVSLGNYISMVSGQAPNADTQSDCNTTFKDVFPGVPGADGQVIGQGCVYPSTVKTVADQLDAKGLMWKGYMQDMANSPSEPKTCRHPAIGAQDDTQSARVGDQYATRHNPFVYFHSIIDDQARCDRRVVDLSALPGDLTSAATTPSYSFITPNLCEDGHDAPCVDGRPGGLVSADAFLKMWVPRILDSPAYGEGGMLMVTWDEGNMAPGAGSSSCCSEPTGPNTPMPGVFGPGGGRTGAIVISPWTKPGSTNGQAYNHYALLRSVEDLFDLGHLGYAGQAGLKPFGDDVFDQPRASAEAARTRSGTGGGTAQSTPKVGCSTRAWVRRDARGRRVLAVRGSSPQALRVTVGQRALRAPKQVRACGTIHVLLPSRGGPVAVRIGGKPVALRRP